MPPPPEGAGSASGTLNMTVNSDKCDKHGAFIENVYSAMDVAAPPNPTTTSVTQPPIKLFDESSDKYNNNSYFVYIESTEHDNLGRLHALKVGHLLHKKLSIKNIVEIKSIGKNRVRVQFKTKQDANRLVTNNLLSKENIKAYIPNHFLETKGLIRGIDTSFNNDYLLENIESLSKVTDITRMKKRIVENGQVTFVNKQSLIITFKGNRLPNEVRINSVIFPVECFYGRVTQCFNCLRYGHISKQCRASKKLCIACGQEKTDVHTCTPSDIFCIHCRSSTHKSNFKDCVVYKKQLSIKKTMIDKCLSFREAEEFLNKSYANLVSSNRFDLLSDDKIAAVEFPPLPKRYGIAGSTSSSTQPNFVSTHRSNQSYRSLSQPATNSNENFSSSFKKRKLPPISPPAPMFPFRFSSGSPLPASTQHPSYIISAEKDKLLNCFTSFFTEFINKIKSTEDVKNINVETIRKDISTLVDNIFSSNP